MKHFTHILFILLTGITVVVRAQTSTLFTTTENIDIANIKAAHLVHGDMWWDPATATPRCEWPKGSGKHVGFVSTLWMAGSDAQSAIRVAAQTYRQKGTDYWPGPIDSATAQTYQISQNWARIWKISSKQVDSFLSQSTHTVSNTPLPILEWPAKGNPYAKGAGGVSLAITRAMAPFVDVNNDGSYNPLMGDYPLIKGNQMLWWVFNDRGVTPHNVSGTNSIGVEVQQMAYAYLRGTIADNIIFYEYQIANKGSLALNQFRIAMNTDFDLGHAFDDYIGFDSTHRMGFTYNAKSVDGNGEPGAYGANPPIAGITIVEFPGDAPGNYVPAGSFMNGDGTTGVEFYRLMHSMDAAGTPLPNGAKYYTNEKGECNSNNLPGDRRFVLASGDLSFQPGETKKIGMALVVAGSGSCPVMNLTGIHTVADTAWYLYNHPPAVLGLPPVSKKLFRIYPNPATAVLYIETAGGAQGSLNIYDALGKSLSLPVVRHGDKIDIATAALPHGVYTIRYQDDETIQTGIFVKE